MNESVSKSGKSSDDIVKRLREWAQLAKLSCRFTAADLFAEAADTIERLKALLLEAEWAGQIMSVTGPTGEWKEGSCPICRFVETTGHYRDCRLAAALKEQK